MTISIHAPRTGSDAEPPAAARAASNFNPRSPHGERRKRFLLSLCNHIISIHAPRTGSDSGAALDFRALIISIHAPRTGSDRLVRQPFFNARISIHAPRTGSDDAYERRVHFKAISIHAPRTGSDGAVKGHHGQRIYFNPRSPHGERQI